MRRICRRATEFAGIYTYNIYVPTDTIPIHVCAWIAAPRSSVSLGTYSGAPELELGQKI